MSAEICLQVLAANVGCCVILNMKSLEHDFNHDQGSHVLTIIETLSFPKNSHGKNLNPVVSSLWQHLKRRGVCPSRKRGGGREGGRGVRLYKQECAHRGGGEPARPSPSRSPSSIDRRRRAGGDYRHSGRPKRPRGLLPPALTCSRSGRFNKSADRWSVCRSISHFVRRLPIELGLERYLGLGDGGHYVKILF